MTLQEFRVTPQTGAILVVILLIPGILGFFLVPSTPFSANELQSAADLIEADTKMDIRAEALMALGSDLDLDTLIHLRRCCHLLWLLFLAMLAVTLANLTSDWPAALTATTLSAVNPLLFQRGLEADFLNAGAAIAGISICFLLLRLPFPAGLASTVAILMNPVFLFYSLAGFAVSVVPPSRRTRNLFMYGVGAIPGLGFLLVRFRTGFSQGSSVDQDFFEILYGPGFSHVLETLAKAPLLWGGAAVIFILLFVPNNTRTSVVAISIVLLSGIAATCFAHRYPPSLSPLLPAAALAAGLSMHELLVRVRRAPRYTAGVALTVLLVGVALPLELKPKALAMTLNYQRMIVEVTELFLQPGDSCLAGLDILYAHPESRAMNRLYREGKIETIIATPPRVVVFSPVIAQPPPSLREFLRTNYSKLSGPVYVYSPVIRDGLAHVALPGQYQSIAGKPEDRSGKQPTFSLESGSFQVAPTNFNGRLAPAGSIWRSKLKDLSDGSIFPNVYAFQPPSDQMK